MAVAEDTTRTEPDPALERALRWFRRYLEERRAHEALLAAYERRDPLVTHAELRQVRLSRIAARTLLEQALRRLEPPWIRVGAWRAAWSAAAGLEIEEGRSRNDLPASTVHQRRAGRKPAPRSRA